MNISISKHAYSRITERFPNGFKPLLTRLEIMILTEAYEPSRGGKFVAKTIINFERVRLVFAFLGENNVRLVTAYTK